MARPPSRPTPAAPTDRPTPGTTQTSSPTCPRATAPTPAPPVGTASFSIYAPASPAGPAFTATTTGTFRRTQAWLQIDLMGTATDTSGNSAAVRLTGSGSWRPTSGDGVLSRITAADVILG